MKNFVFSIILLFTRNIISQKIIRPKYGTISNEEVEYTPNTRLKFNLTGWEFQSGIPKILLNLRSLKFQKNVRIYKL